MQSPWYYLQYAFDRIEKLAARLSPGFLHKPAQPLPCDTSLIQDYSREAQAEMPYRGAYTAHFHKNGKHLHYVAAQHETGPDNDTFRAIREGIASHQPELIIVEGLETIRGMSPSFYKAHVMQKAGENFTTCREPEYAAYQAMQHGLPFIGGEPSDHEVFTQMHAKGYSTDDVAAFYLLRTIPRWVADGDVDATNFDAKAQDYIDHLRYYVEHLESTRLTVDDFKKWYDRHNHQPEKSFLEISSQDMAPFRSRDASYFERMSADTGEIREKHLDHQILSAFSTHDNVLVVYGGGHLVQSRRVFEHAFGSEAEYTKPAPANGESGFAARIRQQQTGQASLRTA